MKSIRYEKIGRVNFGRRNILDAIEAQASRSVADTYGDVTVNAMAREIAKFAEIVIRS